MKASTGEIVRKCSNLSAGLILNSIMTISQYKGKGFTQLLNKSRTVLNNFTVHR
jgi:hypothetical protein